jgi:hypothetical protein
MEINVVANHTRKVRVTTDLIPHTSSRHGGLMSAGIPHSSSRHGGLMSAGIPHTSSRHGGLMSASIPHSSSRHISILSVTLLISPLWDKPMHSPSKNETTKDFFQKQSFNDLAKLGRVLEVIKKPLLLNVKKIFCDDF